MTATTADLEAAYQRYADLEAQAAEALELGNVVGTPEGDRAYELDHDAEVAYEEYLDAWHSQDPAAAPEPEPEMEAAI